MIAAVAAARDANYRQALHMSATGIATGIARKSTEDHLFHHVDPTDAAMDVAFVEVRVHGVVDVAVAVAATAADLDVVVPSDDTGLEDRPATPVADAAVAALVSAFVELAVGLAAATVAGAGADGLDSCSPAQLAVDGVQ